MRKISIIIILFFIAISLSSCKDKDSNNYIEINNHRQDGTSKKFKVEIADTPDLRYQGLSNREGLCEDCGMLFKFDNKKVRTFVMRNMNFPIDIIWIDDDRRNGGASKIIGISKNLPPEGADYKNFYKSDGPANYVLEINAGLSDKYNFKAGDLISY